jgi:cephalosporin-C deacetylase-like acetyl esterase
MRLGILRQLALLLGLALVLLSFLAAQGASPSGAQGAVEGTSSLDLRVLRGTPLEKDYQHMLPNYLLRLASEATEKRLLRLNSIQSAAEFKTWQEANRKKFLELIGGLPEERAPLHARVVGEFAREGYTARKVIFESLPEFYVTANLYVPTTGQAPYPAVLAPCGHSENGKAYDVYQHLFIGLAKRGYVVFSYDPLGQGERLQYWDFVFDRPLFTAYHGLAGIQEYLLGQNLARYFIWDGIRGLDYLASLPEVDADHFGVTGNSGGGTLTTYISMLDPRVKAASIVTFITSLPKKIEARELDVESDPEQDIPGLLDAGIDHTEFVGMIAPRPVLLGAATRDFFPIEGTRQTFRELQDLYRKLGAPERIQMVEFDHLHMYSQPLREATYAWFDRWLKGVEGVAREPEILTEKDAALQCTPTGQVLTSLGGKTVYSFNRARAEELLKQLALRRRDPSFRKELSTTIRERLALPSLTTQPRLEKAATTEAGDLIIERLLMETEAGVVVPTRLIRAEDRSGLPAHSALLRAPSESRGAQAGRLPAVVYFRDREGEQDDPSIFQSLARQGRLVAVADVRGFGETWAPHDIREPSERYFHPRDGEDADFAYAAFFLGRPLLGMRVWDALNVAAYVRSRSDVDPLRVQVVGRGWAGVVALYATAMDPAIGGAAVEGTPASYGAIASAELYTQPVSLLLPGVLQDFDLEDVFSAIAPRPLLVLNPQDPLTRTMCREEAQQAFATVRETFSAGRAGDAFTLQVTPLESETLATMERWILEH